MYRELTLWVPQASTIASPVPLHFNQAGQMSNDVELTGPGRETPLPQYEKTQSVPFTVNLQEDTNNPGQFQLVVNVGPKHALPLSCTASQNAPATTGSGLKTDLGICTLHQTRKSSPPTSPLGDKQDWTDLDNVPTEFLQKVVPDWNITFSRSNSTVSTQSKKLADIGAKIRKKGKGYVVRLLKGSSAGPNEVAEVDLGQSNATEEAAESHELDSGTPPVELDSAQISTSLASDSVLERPGVCEIGTSNELGVQRSRETTDLTNNPRGTSSIGQVARHSLARSSITEEGLSDAETLIPEVQSIYGRMEADPGNLHVNQPIRSDSVSSIVKTPTRGLSVVEVRRIKKNPRIRVTKNRAANLDLNRSGARKSIKHGSSQTVSSTFASGSQTEDARLAQSDLRERKRLLSRNSHGHNENLTDNNTWQYPISKGSAKKPSHLRRSSAEDFQAHSTGREALRVQTNFPRSPLCKSANSSPTARRKRSPRKSKESSSPSPSSLADSNEEAHSALQWSEVNHSEKLLEALHRLGPPVPSIDNSEEAIEERSLPKIIEPLDESHVGEIPLPAEVEIRSTPLHSQSSTIRYLALVLSAFSEKAYEGFKYLHSQYGSEPPVPRGHVRVRWTCVSHIVNFHTRSMLIHTSPVASYCTTISLSSDQMQPAYLKHI
jgi:hypothetical protein